MFHYRYYPSRLKMTLLHIHRLLWGFLVTHTSRCVKGLSDSRCFDPCASCAWCSWSASSCRSKKRWQEPGKIDGVSQETRKETMIGMSCTFLREPIFGHIPKNWVGTNVSLMWQTQCHRLHRPSPRLSGLGLKSSPNLHPFTIGCTRCPAR